MRINITARLFNFCCYTENLQSTFFVILYKQLNIIMDDKEQENQKFQKNINKDNQMSSTKIINSLSAKIHILKPFITILIIIYNIEIVSTLSSVPLNYISQPNIQSRNHIQNTESIQILSLSSYSASISVPYIKPKATVPNPNYVFIASRSLDYQINYLDSFNEYDLYFDIYKSVFSTYINVYIYDGYRRITKLTISILIFDNQFQYFSMIDTYKFYYRKGVSQTSSFTLAYTNYVILRFITYINFDADHPMNTFGFQFNDNLNSPNLDTTINFAAAYNWAYLNMHYLFIYPSQIPPLSRKMVVQYPPRIFTTTSLTTFNISFRYYRQGFSSYIIGLSSFNYNAVNDTLNPGFMWNETFIDKNNLQMSVDSQFTRINYHTLMISTVGCFQSDFAIRSTNRSSGEEQCFDGCYEGQYIDYNVTMEQHFCSACGDPLCKTCQNPNSCSSCVTYYDLNQNGTCTLSSKYYVDSVNNTYLCQSNLTGCETCNSIGTTCNSCFSQYYLQAGSCVHCSNIHTDCIKCTSSTCIQCLSPKILINASLCSTFATPPTPPTPVYPCADSNCLSCNQTNLNICFQCTPQLTLSSQDTCIPVCGDGLIGMAQICDDGATLSYDGCSSDCSKIEDGFACDNISSSVLGYNRSDCYFNRTIQLKVLSIKKKLTQNKLIILLQNLQPHILQWQSINMYNQLDSILQFKIERFQLGQANGNLYYPRFRFIQSHQQLNTIKKAYSRKITSFNQRYLQSSSFNPQFYAFLQLQISYQYSFNIAEQSLNHQNAKLTLDVKSSNRSIFLKSPSSLIFNSYFNLITDDNLIIQVHGEQYYKNVQKVETLAIFISIMVVVMLIISLLAIFLQENNSNSKQALITLQTAFIVQFTYFSLIGIKQVNPLFFSIAKGLKYSLGFDLNLSSNMLSSRQLLGISIESFKISDNVNISILIILICLIVYGLLILLNRWVFKNNSKEQQMIHTSNRSIVDKLKQQQQSPHPQYEDNTKQTKNQKISKILFGNVGFFLFLFFLYKFFFFLTVQVKYGLSSLEGVDMVVSITIIGILFGYVFLIFTKFQLFSSLFKQIYVRKPKIAIFQSLSKNQYMNQQNVKNIQNKFYQFLQALPQTEKSQSIKIALSGSSSKVNVQFLYVLLVIVGHFLNCLTIMFLSQDFQFHGTVPLIFYGVNIFVVTKYKFYNNSNRLRIYLSYSLAIIIQCVFIIRSMLMDQIQSNLGRQQSNLGLYFPYSILVCLTLICIISFSYLLYSIKKIRCCKLQIQWDKPEITISMKLKLQKLIQEEMEQNNDHRKNPSFIVIHQVNGNNNEQSFLNVNKKLVDSMISKYSQIDRKRHNQIVNQGLIKQLYNSFNSSDSKPFFLLPENNVHQQKNHIQSPLHKNQNLVKQIRKQIKANRHTHKFDNWQVYQDKSLNKYQDLKINQQITAKSIKNQIKQKWLNSRIKQRIKSMGQDRLQIMQALKNIQIEQQNRNHVNLPLRANQQIQKNYQSQKQVDSKNKRKNSFNNLFINGFCQANEKNTKKTNNFQSNKNSNDNLLVQDNLAYIYTDKKGYHVDEEFDMI